jgi:tetratricopeptide (TPR) repeat protein
VVPALLALTVLGRLIYFLEILGSPYGNDLILDSKYHHEWAVRLAAGDWKIHEPFFRAPLYPYLMGVLYALSGNSQSAVKLFQIAVSAATGYVLYRLAAVLIGRRGGLVTLFLFAVYGMFHYFANELLLESWLLFPLTLALYLFYRARESGRATAYAASGLVFGLASITRPNVLLVAAAFCPVLFLELARAQGARTALHRTTIFGLAVLMPILPVTAANYFGGGDRVLIASQGGVNFYIGNNPESDGASAVVPGTRLTWQGGYDDQMRLAREALGNPRAKPSAVSDYWYGRGRAFLREQPRAAAALYLKKVYLLFNGYEIGNNRVPRFVARYSRVFRFASLSFWPVFPLTIAGCFLLARRPLYHALLIGFLAVLSVAYFHARAAYGLETNGLDVLGWVLLPAVFIGYGLLLRRPAPPAAAHPSFQWIVLFWVAFGGSFLPFFVNDRYRLGLVPCLLIPAAYALVRLGDHLRSKEGRRGLWADPRLRLAVALAALVAILIKPIDRAGADEAQGWVNEGLAFMNKHDCPGAIPAFERALAVRPDYADAYQQLGRCYVEARRDYEAAARALTRAVELAPGNPDYRNDLGVVHLARGQYAAAEALFARTVGEDPANAQAWDNLGFARQQSGRCVEAIEAYEHVLRLAPRSASAWDQIGGCEIRRGRYDEARSALAKALEITPDLASAREHLAQIPVGH